MVTIQAKHGIGARVRRLALGGALAALLAAGALGASVGVEGAPGQWGVTAGDPSPMFITPPNGNPKTAINFTKVEHKNIPMSGLNFTKVEF